MTKGPEKDEPLERFGIRMLSLAQTVSTALAQTIYRFDSDLFKIFDGRRRSDRFAPSPSEQVDMLFEMLAASEKQLFDRK